MITNLLGFKENLPTIIVIGVIVVGLVFSMWWSNRKGKRRQQEYIEQMDAISPGHKVKTIGGICGIVKEVCDDNTVIIETGSEQSGKSMFKIDKECIAQTDAKGPTQIAREQAETQRAAEKLAKKEGKPVEKMEEVKEESPAQTEEKSEQE